MLDLLSFTARVIYPWKSGLIFREVIIAKCSLKLVCYTNVIVNNFL